jgi:uncharacterized protein with HEPN domain
MWRDEALLLDVVLAVKKVLKYSRAVTKKKFLENEILQDAIMRQLEIIGEAANKISDGLQKAHTNIPWTEMIGMRNRLVHEYFRIDLEKVWETVRRDIPGLLAMIEPLVPPGEKPTKS